MLHILHAADLHLDAPFASLPAHKAAERRAEQRDLIGRLADLARTRGADLVLLSGDLFDSADTYAETTQALARALGQTGCPVFIAPGNHDYFTLRSPYSALHWPENVHIFRSAALEAVERPDLGCAVHGAAFTAPAREDSPLSGFAAPGDGLIHLGVLHGEVDGKGRYGPIPRADIAASGLAYLALGHVHAGSGLQWEGGTAWAYPGCPEGRGFDELGEKGGLWVTLDDGAISVEFVPLARRRYRIVEADVSRAERPEDALLAALPEDAGADILRVLLTGESGVEGLDLAPLARLLEGRFYSADLRDMTRVRRDLWSRAEEDTLTGLFLRRMRERLAAAGDGDERAALERAVRFGLAALEHGEEPMA